jgi:hypothetical protein
MAKEMEQNMKKTQVSANDFKVFPTPAVQPEASLYNQNRPHTFSCGPTTTPAQFEIHMEVMSRSRPRSQNSDRDMLITQH